MIPALNWHKGLSLEQAHKELKEMAMPLNRRSSSAIRKGIQKGEWATLFKLANYLSQKTGKTGDTKTY